MNGPLISVIIPSYNCAQTIGVAIESLVRQTYTNLEIIVIDDHSTDTTEEVVAQYAQADKRVTYYAVPFEDPNRFDSRLGRNINAGYSARNFGFTKVTGQYVTFQDADDASLLNRIEEQLQLLQKYNATHVTLDWSAFRPEHVGKKLNVECFRAEVDSTMLGPQELYTLSQKTKGAVAKLSPVLNQAIPFHLKRKRILNKLFFGSLAPYPGTGNSPMFIRDVINTVQFRPLRERVWPSFMGRGADRDFNFQVAETFKNSYVFPIPMYLWHTRENNNLRPDIISPYLK